jgi:hypothetical protein
MSYDATQHFLRNAFTRLSHFYFLSVGYSLLLMLTMIFAKIVQEEEVIKANMDKIIKAIMETSPYRQAD